MPDIAKVNAQKKPAEPSGIDAAILRWQQELPAGCVCLDADVREQRGRTTFAPTVKIPAVLRPVETAQVQKIMAIASEFRVPVYPISQGRNWGYGSAAPIHAESVVLDLSRMNRILHVDEELAYAVIEPGVTQLQLYEELQKRGGNLWPDATGAGPDASIVGNYLDRGFGHTPLSDHQNQFAGIEIVLADGETLRTGYAALGAERIGDIARGGPGAGIDNLLIQGNFAIVTRMAVWLYPRPESCVAFALRVHEEKLLPRVIEQMRRLRFHNVFNGSPHLANDYRVLGINARFPYESADPTKGLTKSQREELRKEHGVAPWTLLAGIYGPAAQVRANTRTAKKAFRGLGKQIIVTEKLLRTGDFVLSLLPLPLRRTRNDLASASDMMKMLQGYPVAGPRQGAYWRHRDKKYEENKGDPLRDRVGYRGLSPVIPFTGEEISRFNHSCELICRRFGFEFALTITNLSPRYGIGVISITYDRENAEEEQRAIACVDELAQSCAAAGYEPYRLATWAMAAQAARWPESLRNVMLGIKQAFDPGQIIAPGRYLPSNDLPRLRLLH